MDRSCGCGNGWAGMGGDGMQKNGFTFCPTDLVKKRGHAKEVIDVDTDEYKIAATRPKSVMKQDSEGKSLMPYGLEIPRYKMTALF